MSLGVPVGSSLHQLPCVSCHVTDRLVWFISSELGLCPSSPWGQLLLPTNRGFSEPWEIPKWVLLVFPRIPVTPAGTENKTVVWGLSPSAISLSSWSPCSLMTIAHVTLRSSGLDLEHSFHFSGIPTFLFLDPALPFPSHFSHPRPLTDSPSSPMYGHTQPAAVLLPSQDWSPQHVRV